MFKLTTLHNEHFRTQPNHLYKIKNTFLPPTLYNNTSEHNLFSYTLQLTHFNHQHFTNNTSEHRLISYTLQLTHFNHQHFTINTSEDTLTSLQVPRRLHTEITIQRGMVSMEEAVRHQPTDSAHRGYR